MDFDRILGTVGKTSREVKNRRQAPDRKNPAQGKESVPADWLESYLPDAGTVADKENEHIPPVSEGRSIWLRRDPQDTLDLHGFRGTRSPRGIVTIRQYL